MVLLPTLGHLLQSKPFFKESKNQSLPTDPAFVPCLCSAPVACVVRIAGILITQLQPSARIPVTRANTHSFRVTGRLQSQDCQSPTMMFSFSQHPPPPPLPLPAPNLGLILELLNNSKASSSVRQSPF